MKEIISTFTSKGRVTIPAEIRKYLGITSNDKIGFVIDDEGVVRLRVHRYPTIASLRGDRVASCGIIKIGYLKMHCKGEMHDREP